MAPLSVADATADGPPAIGGPVRRDGAAPRRTLPASAPGTAASAGSGSDTMTRRLPPLPEAAATEIMPRLDQETIAALDREHGHDSAAG
jgi:hypothetical protein